MYLTHLVLPKTAANAQLHAELADNPYAEHQALWALFGEHAPGSTQPFLHRADRTAVGIEVYLISERPPVHTEPWTARSKEFAPALRAGQRLSFRMRFCPVIDKAQGPGKRSVRTNAVMDAYRKEEGKRPLLQVANDVAKTWLDARAAAAGATFLSVNADAYVAANITQKGRTFKTPLLDVSGELEVVDPALFLARVHQGWGKSRYAGCGLMLLSRAQG